MIQRSLQLITATLLLVSSAVADTPDSISYLGKDLERNPLVAEDYRGTVIVLAFWATRCPPCREELPWLEGIQRAYGKDRVTVIAINYDESRRVISGATRGKKWDDVQMIIAYDPRHRVRRSLGGIKAIPHTVLLDQHGRVSYEHAGYDEAAIDALVQEINALLETGNGSQTESNAPNQAIQRTSLSVTPFCLRKRRATWRRPLIAALWRKIDMRSLSTLSCSHSPRATGLLTQPTLECVWESDENQGTLIFHDDDKFEFLDNKGNSLFGAGQDAQVRWQTVTEVEPYHLYAIITVEDRTERAPLGIYKIEGDKLILREPTTYERTVGGISLVFRDTRCRKISQASLTSTQERLGDMRHNQAMQWTALSVTPFAAQKARHLASATDCGVIGPD